MPPIRRYIRISPHSLLEVRIFLENPADASRWLLSARDPALPQVFDAVRPLILPKLREERERTAATKGKGKKGKSVKDVVERNDFRVVVFLTEGGTRHEVAVKVKTAKERPKRQQRQQIAGGGRGSSRHDAVVIREEEDDDEDINLADVPEKSEAALTKDDDEDVDDDDDGDDHKKVGFDTRYEGFSIWGKVLCLLVERKGGSAASAAAKQAGGRVGVAGTAAAAGATGQEGAQKVMEEWIASTQVGGADDDDDDGEG